MSIFSKLFGAGDKDKRPLIERATTYAKSGQFAEARELADQILAEATDPMADDAIAAKALLDRLDGIATIHGKQSDALSRNARGQQGDPNTRKPRISMGGQKPDSSD